METDIKAEFAKMMMITQSSDMGEIRNKLI